MKIAFLVEGGLEMGIGHIMRSITLAEEIADRAEICFLTKSDEIAVNQIKNTGFNTFQLKNDSEAVDILQEINPETVIIDRLNVEEDFAQKIKGGLNAKLVIFGNTSTANRYADIVVNGVIGTKLRNRKFIDEDTNTLYLYGPRYYVLRREFYEFKQQGKRLTGKLEKILLILGGSDPSNLTSKVLNELLSFNNAFKIDVILGMHFLYFDALNQALDKYQGKKKNVTIYRDIKNVAELMHNADLVIASPGVSMFEALCVGTPVIAIYQNLLQRSWFEGALPVLDENKINKLKDAISSGDFIKPDTEYIKNLNIAEGKAEIIEAITGVKK